MIKKLMAIICIVTMLLSSTVFAYTRDVPSKESSEEETPAQEYRQQQAPQQPYQYEESGGSGVETMGYVFIAMGGAAAITGSTLAIATDKRLAGAIVGGAGAALGLAGSLMIMLGSSHHSYYGVSPTIDPLHQTYGLTLAANF
jgi:hypothetical protein